MRVALIQMAVAADKTANIQTACAKIREAAACGAEETVLYADLGLDRVDGIRAQLPILSARRTDLYEVRDR